MKLPDEEVMQAVWNAPSGFTSYVARLIRSRRHERAIAGEKGIGIPSTRHVRNALVDLAERGFLTRSSETSGYLGYQWKLTEVSRAAIKGANHP